ncbi:MAG: hypothetical protein AB7E41_17765 [Mycolicibacterium sp.]
MTTPNEAAAAEPTDVEDTDTTVPETDTDQLDTIDADTEQDSPNGEAAKRRRQLREAQTELAAVRDQLTTYQRRHAEQVISDVLSTPADLFDIGQADLADFLDDNGDVRSDELRAAATTLVEQRPQLGTNYQPAWPAHADFGIGVRSQSAPGGPTWSKVLADQRRRQ